VSIDAPTGDDELILSPDGRTIYLALPAEDEILSLQLVE
jgi:hypothetical protein